MVLYQYLKPDPAIPNSVEIPTIQVDCLIRLPLNSGSWGKMTGACPGPAGSAAECKFSSWSASHVKRRLTKGPGDTKTMTLECPSCGTLGKVRAEDRVQFVSTPTNDHGKAYSHHALNHYVIKMPIPEFEIDFEVNDFLLNAPRAADAN